MDRPAEGTPEPAPVVFVVDDDPAMRDALRWLIESVGLAVSSHPTAQHFLDSYESGQPGCVLLDVRMPGMSGLELQQELAVRNLGLPVIIVTAYADVPMAVRALRRGAIDFIEKPFSHQLVLDRIRQAIESDRRRRREEAQRVQLAARTALLTRREREVMELVVAGKANKQIAWELGLSAKTIEAHRSHVMEKMGVDSVADLVRLALLARSDPGADAHATLTHRAPAREPRRLPEAEPRRLKQP